jgi:predicted transcriptional regulator
MAPKRKDNINGITMPQFRRAVARAMANQYHMRQQKIASILGTTQAAVSKYINSNAAPTAPISNKKVKEFIEAAISGDKQRSRRILCEMCDMNNEFVCTFMINTRQ